MNYDLNIMSYETYEITYYKSIEEHKKLVYLLVICKHIILFIYQK